MDRLGTLWQRPKSTHIILLSLDLLLTLLDIQ